jgi:hypothetical protein
MKKFLSTLAILAIIIVSLPTKSRAAGGIYASGGKTVTVGSTLTINVVASGATFDTVSGSISVSGPVSITSFTAGDATWINKPTNGGSFNGAFLGDKKTSFTVATIKLKGTGVGSGSVSVSGASLKNAGAVVGSGAGGTNFTIQKAPDLPGVVKVSSSTHPDPSTAYEATTIALSWVKDAGVDNFSYLLDQVADTTPAAKATDANTSISYPDKAIGVYYFHIRAHKADGWGSASHFKITIKEPDAKIDATLSAPKDIKIEKSDSFINTITDGTVTGIIISGVTEPGFTATLTLTPTPTLPEGKLLSAIADAEGKFQVLLDYPIVAGYHKLTIQGQLLKVLTPVSDEIVFEISQSKGGSINILTTDDINAPSLQVKAEQTKSFLSKFDKQTILYVLGIIVLLALAIFAILKYVRRKKSNNIARSIKG